MMLAGRVAVITGAGSGMGRASAILFAREGAKVVVADIAPESGGETVERIRAAGGAAVFAQVDVARESDLAQMIRTAVEHFGRLDILFNNAGCPQTPKPFETITDEEWEHIMRVNVKSIFLAAKYALPELKRAGKGAILNTASVGGEQPRPKCLAYATSKGAVITITKALAVELAPYGIRVNCVNPGPTDTPMMYKFVPGFNEEIKKVITESTPLKSFVLPEDVANAALFLVSDAAAKITGTALCVDSGSRIGRAET